MSINIAKKLVAGHGSAGFHVQQRLFLQFSAGYNLYDKKVITNM